MAEKRRAKRVREEASVKITLVSRDILPAGKKISYNLTKDISSSGAKIQFNTFLPINTLLKIEIFVKEPPRLISAIGKVRWVKSLYADEWFEMGIEFVDASPEIIKILEEYVKQPEKEEIE